MAMYVCICNAIREKDFRAAARSAPRFVNPPWRATQDCANKFAVARHIKGYPYTQP